MKTYEEWSKEVREMMVRRFPKMWVTVNKGGNYTPKRRKRTNSAFNDYATLESKGVYE